jgi:hypothetical protein
MVFRARLSKIWFFLKRTATNVLILSLLTIFTIDACPALTPRIQELKDKIYAPINRLGIWQGSWTLFAPEVRKINSRVRATVMFQDGRIAIVSTPDWPKLSRWQRFRHYRDGKFTDAIRTDARSWMWPSYARWYALNTPHPDGKQVPVIHVSLARYWNDIPFPSVDTIKLPLDSWSSFENSNNYTFYESGPLP